MLTADPADLIDYVLVTDRAKPEPRPTFRLSALTERESRKVRRLVADAHAAGDDDERAADLLSQAIDIGLVERRGVRHRGLEIKPGTPAQDYLTTAELWELAYAVLTEPALDEQKKRACASLPAAGPGPTAPAAASGPA